MRILVAFGSRYGSTEVTANEMASVLRSEGHDVTVADLRTKDHPSADDYDLVVLGSSIIVGSWSKGSKRFLSENADPLRDGKVALFACCSEWYLKPEERAVQEQTLLRDVASEHGLQPIATGLFGGEIDFSKYNFMVKAVLKKVGVNKELDEAGIDTSRPFDFRDWDAIREWTRNLVR